MFVEEVETRWSMILLAEEQVSIENQLKVVYFHVKLKARGPNLALIILLSDPQDDTLNVK